jgi:sec-independent protein translocase protein TatA
VIGWKELLIVLVIVLLVFGTKRLANIGKDLGEGIRGFRKGMREGQDEPPAGQLGSESRETGAAGPASDRPAADGADPARPDPARHPERPGDRD